VETQTYAITIRSKSGGSVAAESTVFSADAEENFDNSIDAGDTLNEALAVDVSTLEAFFIYSDKDVTVTPMDGLSATADGPFAVAAKKAFWWNTGRQEDCPFTVDFTSLAIHNAGADAAAVKGGFLVHAGS
jgi:hypothetical protein